VKILGEVIFNPLRATLFGKFYEEIIRGWLKEQGYIVHKVNPRHFGKINQFPVKEMIRNINSSC